MFAYLTGALSYKSPTLIHLEASGVGYEVHISLKTYSKIEKLEQVKIWTHFHVKEDAQTLYGFYDLAERSIFVHLISVSGIGPNTARLILSSLDHTEVAAAIRNEDVARLNRLKGIGPKTAKRIILDLRDKMIKENMAGDQLEIGSNNSVKDDALSALLSLGFQRNKIVPTLNKVYRDDLSVEDLIKTVLSQISK